MNKILLFLILLLIGCSPENQESTPSVETVSIQEYDIDGWESIVGVVEVDSCEYVLFSGLDRGGIIHKENCKNPIHRK